MTPAELADCRRALGLSRARLAARLGVDVTTIWRWETGGSPPPPWLALALRALAEEQGR